MGFLGFWRHKFHSWEYCSYPYNKRHKRCEWEPKQKKALPKVPAAGQVALQRKPADLVVLKVLVMEKILCGILAIHI